MAGACLTVANDKNHRLVWKNQPPADFETDLTKLGTDYEAVLQKDALADGAAGGAGDAKSVAETALEEISHIVARALANHFKKTGNLDALGKVNFSKSDIVRLRHQDLLDQSVALRDLSTATQTEAGAADRGVTAARTATLSSAIGAFKTLMHLPRGQVVNRGTFKKEVATDVAALVSHVADMDDLVIQFDGTEAGRRFIEAWKRARKIVDSGGGAGPSDPTPPTPPAPPAK